MRPQNLKCAHHDLRKNIHHLFQLLEFIEEKNELKNPDLIKILSKCLERRGQIDSDLQKFESLIIKEDAV